jgi:hypothetical protein
MRANWFLVAEKTVRMQKMLVRSSVTRDMSLKHRTDVRSLESNKSHSIKPTGHLHPREALCSRAWDRRLCCSLMRRLGPGLKSARFYRRLCSLQKSDGPWDVWIMWTCLSAHKSIDRVIVVLIQNFMTKAVRLETSLYQVIRVFEPRKQDICVCAE